MNLDAQRIDLMSDHRLKRSVSIIVPAFNAAKHIGSSLESISRQTIPPEQILVVDDGSTDSTVKIVADWRDQSRQHVEIIRKANGGAASARNAGFASATGELVAFLDADDLMYPNHLEALAAPFANHEDVVLSFGIAEARSDDGRLLRVFPDARVDQVTVREDTTGSRLLGGSVYSSLIDGSYIGTSATLMSRNAAETIHFMDESLSPAEDRDFWLRLSRIGTFVFQPTVVAIYRQHEGNTTHPKHRLRHMRSQLRVLHKMIVQADELKLDAAERQRTYEAIETQLASMIYFGSQSGLSQWLKTCDDLRRFRHAWQLVKPRPWLRALAYSTIFRSRQHSS